MGRGFGRVGREGGAAPERRGHPAGHTCPAGLGSGVEAGQPHAHSTSAPCTYTVAPEQSVGPPSCCLCSASLSWRNSGICMASSVENSKVSCDVQLLEK